MNSHPGILSYLNLWISPMKPRLFLMILPLVLLLSSVICFAGDYEDGEAAYKRADYKTAAAVWTKAANKGDPRAQVMLGSMYADGQGVPQDYKQAALWYREAADQGISWAQYNLGFMYATGQGIPQNYIEAYKWFHLAAYATDKSVRDKASENRDIVGKTMTSAQIAEAQKRAKEWKKK
jgi:uncharacterized protein